MEIGECELPNEEECRERLVFDILLEELPLFPIDMASKISLMLTDESCIDSVNFSDKELKIVRDVVDLRLKKFKEFISNSRILKESEEVTEITKMVKFMELKEELSNHVTCLNEGIQNIVREQHDDQKEENEKLISKMVLPMDHSRNICNIMTSKMDKAFQVINIIENLVSKAQADINTQINEVKEELAKYKDEGGIEEYVFLLDQKQQLEKIINNK